MPLRKNSSIIHCALVCPSATPGITNGVVLSGDGAPFFNGEVVSYKCNLNFDSTDAPLSCTCDITSDPNVPAWDCGGANFATTCRRSKSRFGMLQVSHQQQVLKNSDK